MKDIVVNVSTRVDLSYSHLSAAKIFSEAIDDIEKKHNDPHLNNKLFGLHRAYAISSIYSAVAFLEARINEFFIDTVDSVQGNNNNCINILDQSSVMILEKLWTLTEIAEKTSILGKYEVALSAAKNIKIERGKYPYQDVFFLISLRNALVHYKPEWVSDDKSDTEKTLSRKLFTKLQNKFKTNPYVAEGNSFFPDKCLGAGCAKWAVKVSVDFVNEFLSKIGYTSGFVEL